MTHSDSLKRVASAAQVPVGDCYIIDPYRVSGDSHGYYDDGRMSQSKLKTYQKCPTLYKAIFVDKTYQMEETDTLLFGRAVDCMITEPKKFGDKFVVVKRRSSKEDPYETREQLTESLAARVAETVARINQQPVMQEFAWMGKQVELYTQTKKARLDYFGIKGRTAYIADLKTTSDLDKFYTTIHDWGYFLQFTWYKRIVKELFPFVRKVKCYIPAVDKTKNLKFGVFEIDQRHFKTEEATIDRILKAMEKNERVGTGVCIHCPPALNCPWSRVTKKDIVKI